MKIAVITDNGETISAHFGRARHFLVFDAAAGKIVGHELRDKAGHDDFTAHEHGQGHHDHHEHHGRHDPRGHGFGHGSGRRHARMLAAIEDCNVLLARGMGRGAYQALKQANITPITTEIKSAEEAVQAFLTGSIVDRPERRH